MRGQRSLYDRWWKCENWAFSAILAKRKEKAFLAISVGLTLYDAPNRKVNFPVKMRGQRSLYDHPLVRYENWAFSAILAKKKGRFIEGLLHVWSETMEYTLYDDFNIDFMYQISVYGPKAQGTTMVGTTVGGNDENWAATSHFSYEAKRRPCYAISISGPTGYMMP